jgi:hypothetical protein
VLLLYLAVVAVAVALIALRPVFRRAGYGAGLRDSPALAPVPVGEFLGTAFIGGFRAVAVDIAWVRAMRLQQEQKWYELLALYDLIANLQPRLEPVWAFNAWNMAFNISNAVDDEESAWQWVKRGLEFAAKGCERNPGSYTLRTTLAQMYFTRCGSINDERTRYYSRRLREETGRSNWQWTIHWTKEAIAASDKVPPFSRNYIPISLDRMARQALERGDLAEMRHLRYEAIQWWEQIVQRFPRYDPGRARIEETQSRLRAYDLQEQADRSLRDGDSAGWLKEATEITIIWEHLLASDPWDEETVRGLKGTAKAWAAQASVLRQARQTDDAEACERESERLWQLLARRTDDPEAAAHVRGSAKQ